MVSQRIARNLVDRSAEVVPGLFVLDDLACGAMCSVYGAAVVHACKEPCHRKALGYRGRNPIDGHPGYWAYQQGPQLYLNLIDADDVRYVSTKAIRAALDFLAYWEQFGNVVIHCNQGRSRAPSIALMHLVQRGGYLPREYDGAVVEFRKLYPAYAPGRGIAEWMRRYWDVIVDVLVWRGGSVAPLG
ncbi:MAG: phosphatase [Patescibacteria group bacterium]|nr:phosphatase [Patescibacteria group bacterium]